LVIALREQAVGMGLVDPIRLQPIQHVVMTRHRDELQMMLTNGLCDGGRADAGGGAIDDGGIFVDELGKIVDHGIGQRTSQADAELLAVGESVERPNPRRRAGETDAAEQADDFPHGQRHRKAVENAAIGRPFVRAGKTASEKFPGNGRLPAAAGPDNHADVPALGQIDVHIPLLNRLRRRLNVEHPQHL